MEIQASIYIKHGVFRNDTKVKHQFPHQFISQIGYIVILPKYKLDEISENLRLVDGLNYGINQMEKMVVKMVEYDYDKLEINLILSI